MKYWIFLLLVTFAGCASVPKTTLMANCKELGHGVFQCEELSRHGKFVE